MAKVCTKCGGDGPFYTRKRRGRIELTSRCRACTIAAGKTRLQNNPTARQKAYAAHKRWYDADPEFGFKAVRSGRLKSYGITASQLVQLYENQEGLCAICSKLMLFESPGKRAGMRNACIDHDHTTGKVRGLLCGHCNTSIGRLNDSARLCRNAAQYLEGAAVSA